MGFDVNTAISGDITIGLWFGDHKGEWDLPALAYSFHTAFVEQVRQDLLLTDWVCMWHVLHWVQPLLTLCLLHAGLLQLLGAPACWSTLQALWPEECLGFSNGPATLPAFGCSWTGHGASIWLLLHWQQRHC